MLKRQSIGRPCFVPGSEAERHAALVRDVGAAGHEVAAMAGRWRNTQGTMPADAQVSGAQRQ